MLPVLVASEVIDPSCWPLSCMAAGADRNAISPALLALETNTAN
jgi:hypothetical protein